ncbi:hypothetical protein A2U01_0111823, partial [Trifolium medium]|nr:hypothetical protein [Trifolium medium]
CQVEGVIRSLPSGLIRERGGLGTASFEDA